jgi:hypothetical protein
MAFVRFDEKQKDNYAEESPDPKGDAKYEN